MTQRYALTPNQVAVLRALNGGIVEISAAEVAVSALLLPSQANTELTALERLGLASSWAPITGRTGERLFVLTEEGRNVCRALAQFRGSPPVGAFAQVPSGTPFRALISRVPPSYVGIVSEENQAARE